LADTAALLEGAPDRRARRRGRGPRSAGAAELGAGAPSRFPSRRRGRDFFHAKEIYLGASAGAGGIGYQLLTPLEEPGGAIVFVNRGYIPAELKNPAKRAAGQVSGTVRVVGLLRLPPNGRPNWFLPDNRPDLNYWFWIDLPAMAAADAFDRVAPFYIDADAAPNPGGWPKGGVTRLELPNDHLQYAITWFSLAVALIVVYLLYHRRRAGAE